MNKFLKTHLKYCTLTQNNTCEQLLKFFAVGYGKYGNINFSGCDLSYSYNNKLFLLFHKNGEIKTIFALKNKLSFDYVRRQIFRYKIIKYKYE